MRKVITTLTLLILGINGFGQSKPLPPGSYTFIGGQAPILKVIPMAAKIGYPIDSLLLYVKKSKTHWLNDSVLVINH